MHPPLVDQFLESILIGDWLPNRTGLNIVNFQEFINDPARYAGNLNVIVPLPPVREVYGLGGKYAWQVPELRGNTQGKSLPELEAEWPELTEMIALADKISRRLNEKTAALKEKLSAAEHVLSHDQAALEELKASYKSEKTLLNSAEFGERERERLVA